MCAGYAAASAAAGATGRIADASRWAELASSLRRHLRTRLLVEETGVFAEGLNRRLPPRATTNAAALIWGGLAPVERERVASALAGGGALTPLGVCESALVAEALFRAGSAAEALGVVRRRFGAMVARGASELWEEVEADAPLAVMPVTYRPGEGPSLAFGPAGVAAALLARYVLGIRFTSARGGGSGEGWSVGVALGPGAAPVDRAKGAVPVPGTASDVELEWKAARGRLDVRGRLPDGTGAELVVPLVPDETGLAEHFELLWNGRVFYTADGRALLPPEVERCEASESEVRLDLRPGTAFRLARRPAKVE
jgi:hypothetical protein